MGPKSTNKDFNFNELFLKFIANTKNGKRLQPNGKKISEGTIANYVNTLKLVNDFSQYTKFELRIRCIRYLNKRELVVESNYWKKFYKKFTAYCNDTCGHYDNYVGLNVKNLRVFFNYLNRDMLLNVGEFHKKFYVRKEEIPIIALLPEELNHIIYDAALVAKLTTAQEKVKDLFVFGCTVALRVSDLLALKKTNIRTIGNEKYLLVRSKKTNTPTQIRLPEHAIAILQKYKYKDRLLPYFNVVILNKHIKKLCELAGFTSVVGKHRDKQGSSKEIKTVREKNESARMCDLVTTHTMRRTAITTMLCLGMPEQVVRKISGHSPMSKEFFRYVSIAQTYQDKETEKVFDLLKEKKMGMLVS